MYDSRRKRGRTADRALGGGAGWAPRLFSLGPLWLSRINAFDLPGLERIAHDPAVLWQTRAVRAIKKRVLDAISGPHWAKIEFAPGIGLHVHVVGLEVPALAAHSEPVQDIRNVIAYLSKPPDARSAKDREGRYKHPESSRLEAEGAFLKARARARARGSRLPALSWVHGIPR